MAPDGIKIIENAAQTEVIAQSIPNTGVYLVPAYRTLCSLLGYVCSGSYYWDNPRNDA